MDDKPYFLGLDLGGTKMLCAAIGKKGEILHSAKEMTRAEKGSDDILKRMIQLVKNTILGSGVPEKDFGGLGIGFPGPVDSKKGIIYEAPNLGFKMFPLKEKLQKALNLPVHVENDVNAGTWAEFKFGAGKGKTHVIGIFPGTGIGGGLILNGQLFRGARGAAGEIGHMCIDICGLKCSCGGRGCIESMASRSAIAKEIAGFAIRGKALKVAEKAGGDISKIRSKTIYKAIEDNDKDVIEIVDTAAKQLGIALANCANIFDPDMLIIGGGLVEKLGTPFLKKAEKSMKSQGLPRIVSEVEVAQAKLGDDAVLLGAVDLLKMEANP